MNIAVNLKLTRKDLVNFAIAHVYRRKMVLGIAALAVTIFCAWIMNVFYMPMAQAAQFLLIVGVIAMTSMFFSVNRGFLADDVHI